jgi:hypothetical protein
MSSFLFHPNRPAKGTELTRPKGSHIDSGGKETQSCRSSKRTWPGRTPPFRRQASRDHHEGGYYGVLGLVLCSAGANLGRQGRGLHQSPSQCQSPQWRARQVAKSLLLRIHCRSGASSAADHDPIRRQAPLRRIYQGGRPAGPDPARAADAQALARRPSLRTFERGRGLLGRDAPSTRIPCASQIVCR